MENSTKQRRYKLKVIISKINQLNELLIEQGYSVLQIQRYLKSVIGYDSNDERESFTKWFKELSKEQTQLDNKMDDTIIKLDMLYMGNIYFDCQNQTPIQKNPSTEILMDSPKPDIILLENRKGKNSRKIENLEAKILENKYKKDEIYYLVKQKIRLAEIYKDRLENMNRDI